MFSSRYSHHKASSRYKLARTYCLTLVLCGMAAPGAGAGQVSPAERPIQAPVDYTQRNWSSSSSVSLGYASAEMDWNIASDLSGHITPNILSELEWDDLDLIELSFEQRLLFGGRWHLELSADYAWINDGEVQDSDYAGDNRTLEFSRSNSKTDGDYSYDIWAAGGMRFVSGDITLTPLFGYSHHRQRVNIIDGAQTVSNGPFVPAVGPIAGLDSRFETRWRSLWVGLEAERRFPTLRIYWRIEYHDADYRGEGFWNLRTDFAQNPSFRHTADAEAWVFRAGLSKRLSDALNAKLEARSQRWETNSGDDVTFMSSGARFLTRLNEANYHQWGLRLALEYTL